MSKGYERWHYGAGPGARPDAPTVTAARWRGAQTQPAPASVNVWIWIA